MNNVIDFCLLNTVRCSLPAALTTLTRWCRDGFVWNDRSVLSVFSSFERVLMALSEVQE